MSKNTNWYRARYHFDNYPQKEGMLFDDFIMHQLGDIYCGTDTVINEHTQYCDEITYVISGTGSAFTNEKEFPLHKGILHITFAEEKHKIVSDPVDPLRFYFLGFTLSPKHKLYSPFRMLLMKARDGERCTNANLNIETTFVKAFSELLHPTTYSNMLLESYTNEILINLLRLFLPQEQPTQTEYSPQINEKFYIIFKSINYIDQNISSLKNVNEMYKAIGYSSSYISHIFHEYVNTSPAKYFQNAKMNLAAKLLASNHSVTEVADLLHYSSIHPFCRAFVKHFGKTPSDYIKTSKNQQPPD